jgi:hypothetical protein
MKTIMSPCNYSFRNQFNAPQQIQIDSDLRLSAYHAKILEVDPVVVPGLMSRLPPLGQV